MSTKVDQSSKQKIWDWIVSTAKAQNIEVTAVNKTQAANKFGVSPRTVGRIVEQFNNQSDTINDEVKVDEKITADVVTKVSAKVDVPKVVNWTITQNSVLLTLSDGNNASITKDNGNFKEVCRLLMEGNLDVLNLVNPAKGYEYEFGHIKVVEDGVLFDGKKLPKEIAFFVIDAVRAENHKDAERFAKFLNNLLENPSYRAVRELYGFLKHNDIQITDDGYFLAWKKVRSTYYDIHSNTMFNGVGEKLSVPRNMVDENSERCCSYGLHVCAKSYLSSFGNDSATDRILCVKVNPADVVAIPSSYANAKMRCCGYEVISDVTDSFK